MIGILLITHGRLGESLIDCASHVVGARPQHLLEIGLAAEDDPDAVLRRARAMLGELNQGDGVLVLSDIRGATPSNVACRLLEPGRVEGLSGVNLPMLVRTLTYRRQPLGTVVDKALSGGRDGVVQLTKND